MNLFVSIVVPNYNHCNYIEDRIQSILNQTYTNFELILLDDCSLDNSVELLNKYRLHPKVSHFIVNGENSGSNYIQWNKGVSLAKGDLIWIAESDDTCDTTFLGKMVQAFYDEHVVLAFSQSNRMNYKGEIVGDWHFQTDMINKPHFESDFKMNGRGFIEQFLIYRNVIPNASGVVFRKSSFDLIKGAREDVKYCADWLLWIQILMANGKIFYTSQKLNNFRFHENSVIATSTTTSSVPFMKRYDIILRKEFNKLLKEFNLINLYQINLKHLKKEILEEILFLSKLKKTSAILELMEFNFFIFKFNFRQKLSFLKQLLLSI